MLKILVDTCVWRHWFTSDKITDKSQLDQCASFEKIYSMVLASPESAVFQYNALVQYELGPRFEDFFSRKVLPHAVKIPIPRSRYDGRYFLDGSIGGGRMGGSLKDFLTFGGYKQDIEVERAAATLTDEMKLYETKPRKREFDVEHMESALEAKSDLFITDDKSTILDRLGRMSEMFESDHPINQIYAITMLPSVALNKVQERLHV